MHRNLKITRNTDDSLYSGMKPLLPSWLLGFSTRGKRDTIFTMLTVPLDPTTHGAPPRPHWTGLTQVQKYQLASSSFKSQLTAFFQKSPKVFSPLLPGMMSFTSPVSFTIWGFYYVICDCHILPARAWTRVLNVCPYPCTKPKSSKSN